MRRSTVRSAVAGGLSVLTSWCAASDGRAADPTPRASGGGMPRSLRAERLLDAAWLRVHGIERPTRLAFDESGALYVLDARARRVARMAISGERGGASPDPGAAGTPAIYGEEASTTWLPSDVALDVRGSLLVLDRSRAAVAAFGPRAEALGSRDLDPSLASGARDPGARLLRDPYGDLWLLVPRERDLVPLDAKLLRRRQGRFLTPEDSVGVPTAATFLPRGGGWIADPSAHRCRRFEATGRLVAGASSPDSIPMTPSDLAADDAGALYVADASGGRVLVFGDRGAPLATFWLGGGDHPWRPTAVAWGPDDRVVVADERRGEIWILAVDRQARP